MGRDLKFGRPDQARKIFDAKVQRLAILLQNRIQLPLVQTKPFNRGTVRCLKGALVIEMA